MEIMQIVTSMAIGAARFHHVKFGIVHLTQTTFKKFKCLAHAGTIIPLTQLKCDIGSISTYLLIIRVKTGASLDLVACSVSQTQLAWFTT